ncbi:hypothetical protein OG912_22475 [Streptomyces sp. NBC_00464]|uniref:hypothetical protein n=1 Tax=Streptomyces sp. NBC_00464 TaxID=2975751 RepID=UPI002E197B11
MVPAVQRDGNQMTNTYGASAWADTWRTMLARLPACLPAGLTPAGLTPAGLRC